MAVSKSVIVLLALVAVAAAETARVKKQVLIPGAYPYVAAVPALKVLPPATPAGEDDGSWVPGKYDPLVVPVTAPLAYAAPLPYAAPIPYAHPSPYIYPVVDDGSYFPGKYGPETIL